MLSLILYEVSLPPGIVYYLVNTYNKHSHSCEIGKEHENMRLVVFDIPVFILDDHPNVRSSIRTASV